MASRDVLGDIGWVLVYPVRARHSKLVEKGKSAFAGPERFWARHSALSVSARSARWLRISRLSWA